MPSSPEHESVRIFPLEGGWAVGFAVGYYSVPFSKAEALSKAARIAADAGFLGIAVTDEFGNREQWLPLESLNKRAAA